MIFTPSSTLPMNELVHVHVVSKIRICIIDERSDTILAKGIRKKAIMIVKRLQKHVVFHSHILEQKIKHVKEI